MKARLLAVLAIALCASRQASAQCGAKTSSCSTCHDGARAPVPSADTWHQEHAFADLCAACHGGRGDSMNITEAHAGLVEPLGGETCASCHGGRTPDLVARYRTRSLAEADAGAPGSTSSRPSARLEEGAPPSRGERLPNALLTGLVGAVGAAGAIFVARTERRRRGPARPQAASR